MPAAKKPTRDSHKKRSNKRWVSRVKTVSTYPPEGTFSQDAETIARVMASKKVSPKGVGSGIKMIQYFINRGGKGLTAARKRELEKGQTHPATESRPLQIASTSWQRMNHVSTRRTRRKRRGDPRLCIETLVVRLKSAHPLGVSPPSIGKICPVM